MLPALVVLGAHPSWLRHLPSAIKQLLGSAEPNAAAHSLASVLRWLVFAGVSVLLLGALARPRARQHVLTAAAIMLTAFDLIALGKGQDPTISKAQADPPPPPAVEVMRRLTAEGGRVVGISALEPNTASRWGLDDARGHEDPTVARTELLWYALGGGIELNAPGVDPGDARTPKLLDVFGVRAILLDPSARRASHVALPPPLRHAPVAYDGRGGVVVSNPYALPEAFVAYRWRQSPSRGASILLMAARTAQQARDDPVIETNRPSPSGVGPPATPARISSRTDDDITLDVRARTTGELVLLDTFYPGWRAEIDGHPEPIRAADGAFRAVPVPAGRHAVRFYYRPMSVITGGLISIGALTVIIVMLVFGGWRRFGGPKQVGRRVRRERLGRRARSGDARPVTHA